MVRTTSLALLFTATFITGCNHEDNDVIIKTDLAIKAKSELDFSGVRFTVQKGVVTLSGECPTKKAWDKVDKTVRNLYGVDSVINRVIIADVIIGKDLLLKQGVDSILRKYATVEAITRDSVVLLKGKLQKDKMTELETKIRMLGPKALEQELEFY